MPSPFVYLYVFPTIPTSPDPGLTSRCGWTAQANPPCWVLGQGHGKGQWVDAHSNCPFKATSDRMTRLAGLSPCVSNHRSDRAPLKSPAGRGRQRSGQNSNAFWWCSSQSVGQFPPSLSPPLPLPPPLGVPSSPTLSFLLLFPLPGPKRGS